MGIIAIGDSAIPGVVDTASTGPGSKYTLPTRNPVEPPPNGSLLCKPNLETTAGKRTTNDSEKSMAANRSEALNFPVKVPVLVEEGG